MWNLELHPKTIRHRAPRAKSRDVEIIRQRSDESLFLALEHERDAVGMERRASEAHSACWPQYFLARRSVAPIQVVGDNRVADGGEVNSYLVCPARERTHFHIRGGLACVWIRKVLD